MRSEVVHLTFDLFDSLPPAPNAASVQYSSIMTLNSQYLADPQSQLSAELDKLTDSDDLGNLTMDNGDDSVPPPTQKLCGAECGDIASYKGKSQQLSDAVRYQLLVNHFRPNITFKFPRSANGHSFQHRWLQQYSWLCYSKLVSAFLVFSLLQEARPWRSCASTTDFFCKGTGVISQQHITSLQLFERMILRK